MVANDRTRNGRLRLMQVVLTIGGTVLLTGLLQARSDSETSEESGAKPGTSAYHQPQIADARLVIWGVETSIRAYYFETGQQAESFTEATKVFQIATPFKLVVTEAEPRMADYDKQRLVFPPNFVDQIERKDQVFILLNGTRKQHDQLEAVMRAVGRD